MAVRFCPNCMNIIHKKDKKCSSCGMSVEDMGLENDKSPSIFDELKELKNKKNQTSSIDDNGVKLSKREQRKLDEQKEIDFEKAFSEDDQFEETTEESISTTSDESSLSNDEMKKPKRHKHKSKSKKEKPDYSITSDGEYQIDTKDVTFFESQEEYSVKKARGDVAQEKIKWWEIYKWADLLLARRKIKKEVNKAARVKPDFVSKTKMVLLSLFFGWLGLHNFHAGNKKRGWSVIVMLLIVLTIVLIEPLYIYIGSSVGGCLGFIVLSMWMYDFVCICFNKYKYDISKMQFIRKLNTATRAKLGKKYINIK